MFAGSVSLAKSKKTKTVSFWFSATVIIVVTLLPLTSLSASKTIFVSNTVPPIPTEARGGLMGSLLGELRCPANLLGDGPTWRGITVGKSSLNDLNNLYSPYKSTVGAEATPFQPSTANYPKGTYAVNYVIDIDLRSFQAQLGLPRLFKACIVNGTVAAFVILANDDPTVPHSIEQIISLLGRPTVISWHEDGGTNRLLHWPKEGISVQVSDYVVVDYIYYYPYRGINYEQLWPINSRLIVAPTAHPIHPEQPTLDYFGLNEIEATLTISPAWPTRTPRPTATR